MRRLLKAIDPDGRSRDLGAELAKLRTEPAS
jgi:hypothetical protein